MDFARLVKILKCPHSGKDLDFGKNSFRTNDGKYAYPIVDGIVIMMGEKDFKKDKDKSGVAKFYNRVGWKKAGENYADADKYEDLRPVSAEYINQCHLRVNKYLKNEGDYFLDAGSGPIQYDEYLSYSKNYKKRVCVDISLEALREAKRKLGNKGVYILGDLTNLPFKDNVFDGAVSMHVVYHVRKQDQPKAFNEIRRVLKPKAAAAVIYSWPEGFNILNFVGKMARYFGFVKRPATTEEFYFQPQNIKFLKNNLNFEFEIYTWRSVSVNFLKKYIRPNFFGQKILAMIFNLENVFPKLFGRIGRYPLILIKK